MSTSDLDSALRQLVMRAICDAMSETMGSLGARLDAIETASPTETYLTAEQAAAVAGVSPETVRVWARQGELPRCFAGNKLRIRRSDLDAYLSRTVDKPAEPDDDRVAELIAEARGAMKR